MIPASPKSASLMGASSSVDSSKRFSGCIYLFNLCYYEATVDSLDRMGPYYLQVSVNDVLSVSVLQSKCDFLLFYKPMSARIFAMSLM